MSGPRSCHVRALRAHRSPPNSPRSRLLCRHHSAAPSLMSATPSPAGGAQQPACSGTAADSPLAPSTRTIDAGSWIAASTRRTPEHFGQTKTSIRNARCGNSAHEYRRRPPRRLPPPCGPAAAPAPAAPPVASATRRRRRPRPPCPPQPRLTRAPRLHHRPRADSRRPRLPPPAASAPPSAAGQTPAPTPRDTSPGASAASEPARTSRSISTAFVSCCRRLRPASITAICCSPSPRVASAGVPSSRRSNGATSPTW